MSRTLTPAALAKLQEQYGSEPINVLRIYWNPPMYTQYADTVIYNSKAHILTISNIDEITNLTGSGASSTLSVTLSDADGTLLSLINSQNIINVKLELFQTFKGLNENEMFLLFTGLITSGITWNEGDRTLAFQVESRIKSLQVGFSPEEGQFTDVQDSLIGESWPLCFGTPMHVKAALGRTTQRGSLATRVTIPDPVLKLKQRLVSISKQNLKKNHDYLLNLIEKGESLTPKPIQLRDEYTDLILEEDALKQKIEDMSQEVLALQSALDVALSDYDADPSSDALNKVVTMKNTRQLLVTTLEGFKTDLNEISYMKKIYERQVANCKYGFNFVGKIRKRISTLLANYEELETQERIISVVSTTQALDSNQAIIVSNGEKFPQNTTVEIDVDKHTLSGKFDGRQFIPDALVPSYINVPCGLKIDTELNSFYISDPTIKLGGKYALLPSGDIIRITQQNGLKCYFELREKIDETTLRKSDFETTSEFLKQARDGLKDLLTGNETDEQLKTIVDEIPKNISYEVYNKLCGEKATEQILELKFNPGGGTFKILVEEFETEEIPYNCTPIMVKNALLKIPTIIGRRLLNNITSPDFISVKAKDPTKTKLNETPFIITFDPLMLPMPNMSVMSGGLLANQYAQRLITFKQDANQTGLVQLKLPNGEVTEQIYHNATAFDVYKVLSNTTYFGPFVRVTGGPLGQLGGSSIVIEDRKKRKERIEIVIEVGTIQFEISSIYTNDINSNQPTQYHPIGIISLNNQDTNTASEYTQNEIEKMIKEAIGQTQYADQLNTLKKKLLDLMNSFDKALNADNWALFQEAGKYLRDYVNILKQIQIPNSVVQEAYRIISEKEYRILLDLEILEYMNWKRSLYPIEKEVKERKENYYVLGEEIKALREVAGTILPQWLLKFSNIQDDQEFIKMAHRLPSSEATYYDPGTDVKLASDNQEKYVANILPSTLRGVFAYRSVEGIKSLSPVPLDYFTYNESESYGDLTLTTITLRRPLSDYELENWEDDLYVTFESSVGPNVADIMQWVLTRYTTVSADFSSVRSKYEKYPANFAVMDREDALKLCADIAWQSRSVLIIKHGIAYLKYYPERPTSVATITASDINQGSLKITCEDNLNVVTKFIAEWQPHYAVTKKNRIIFRHNVKKFDENEETFNFYIYDNEQLVRKSATFWLMRKANLFKIIDFVIPMHRLDLELQDYVTIDLPNNMVANGPILGEIRKFEYNSEGNQINVQVWLPVLFGQNTEYTFAFPANLSVTEVFPSTDIIVSGNAGSPLGQRVPNGDAYDPFGDPALFLTLRSKRY